MYDSTLVRSNGNSTLTEFRGGIQTHLAIKMNKLRKGKAGEGGRKRGRGDLLGQKFSQTQDSV